MKCMKEKETKWPALGAHSESKAWMSPVVSNYTDDQYFDGFSQ